MKPVPLDDLIALALAAGREIMAVREASFDVLDKSDGSPVTIADQRAEAVIEAGLKRLAPDVPMIGEEAVAGGRIPDPGAFFFCVDPLDGTRDFIAKGEEFTVNIALVENYEPTRGVVFAPASGALYVGEPGRALAGRADLATGAQTMAPIHGAAPEGAWRVITSRRSGRKDDAQNFMAALGAHVHVAASSSIKFCRLAEGAADLYPRFGEISEWDAAAGHAVLSAAGGGVMDLSGKPLRYGRREDAFLMHGFVAFAGTAAASAARDALMRSA